MPVQNQLVETINNLHSTLDQNSFYSRLEEALDKHLGTTEYSILYHDNNREIFTCSITTLTNEKFMEDLVESAQEEIKEFYEGGTLEGLQNSDLWDDPNSPPVMGEILSFQGNPFGIILLHGSENGEVRKNKEVFSKIARATEIELIKLQLYESANQEAQTAGEKITAINRTAGLLKNLDLDTLLTKLMDLSLNIVGAEVGSIMLRDGNQLISRVEFGLRDEIIEKIRDSEGNHFVQSVIDGGEPVLVSNLPEHEDIDTSELDVHIQSLIVIPLETQSEKLGSINIVDNESTFSKNDFEILKTISSLASHSVENAILQEQQIENERLKEEMEIARKIQGSLLPEKAPDLETIDLTGWSIPCDETGGDYFDFLEIDENHIAVIVGDATGHGLGAALTMLITRAVLLTRFEKTLELSTNFTFLSDRLERDTEDDRFMTLFCGMINLDKQEMEYCSAGHEGPLWFRSEDETFDELQATGVPLGIMEGAPFEVSEGHRLNSGDILILATDGIWEAMNAESETFGKDRLKDVVREHAGGTADDVSQAIQEQIQDFMGDVDQRDDITLVVGKIP